VSEATGLYDTYGMISTLCPYAEDGVYTSVYDGTSAAKFTSASFSYCENKEPAGFYAVVIYDADYLNGGSTTTDAGFRMLTRGGYDYKQDTKFNVFTTTGHLQLVRNTARAFTVKVESSESYDSDLERIPYMFTDTVYFAPYANAGTNDDYGQHDCESLEGDLSGIAHYDCIEKGDLIMMLALGYQSSVSTHGYLPDPSPIATTGQALITPTRFLINPIYPNIYTVEKLSRENRGTSSEAESNFRRTQMKLNMGVNAQYVMSATAATDYGAYIYKFYPPTGYNYVAECSNRGVCDSTSGICQCFSGYTNDNCDTQNALSG